MHLKVNEIYQSIQGESSFAGLPCIFIRTSGCSLRCSWCDTAYAFYEGKERSFESILEEIAKYNCFLVELTGGEPLDQKNAYLFLTALCDAGYTVLLETGGHRPIATLDPRVHCIMDVKCPTSRMKKSNRWENLQHVSKKDEVKFVIGNREDYEWALGIVHNYRLSEITNPLFAPVHDELHPRQLTEWILADKAPVRFQVQLHKYIWGKDAQGV